MAQKQYLDDNGNTISAGKTYLDENGNPTPNPANLTPEMRGNLARNASPTQFEAERPRTAANDAHTSTVGDFFQSHNDAPPAIKQPGFGGAVADYVRGFVSDKPNYQLPMEGAADRPVPATEYQTEKREQAEQRTAEDQARKSAGYGRIYRAAAQVAPAIGINPSQVERSADIGDSGGVAGGVAVPAALSLAPVIGRGAAAAGERTASFLRAPSDPNALYSSYLRPVANAPHSVPNAPEPVMRGVLRDMEAAGEGTAAERIASGRATIGDLDQMRQRANRLSRSIYRSPGNYPPGLAEGADNFASSLRDEIYPAIEKSQGLEPGSLRDVKRLQGKLMESERHPTFTNRIIKSGVGAAGGGVLGYKIGGPVGAGVGAVFGERFAEPMASAIDRGIVGFQTKRLASSLPEPGFVPRAALPFPRTMPESSIPVNPTQPPPVDATTRAQRFGFLLPEPKPKAIELSSSVEPLPDNPTQPPQRTVFREPKTGKMKRGYTSGGKKITE